MPHHHRFEHGQRISFFNIANQHYLAAQADGETIIILVIPLFKVS